MIPTNHSHRRHRRPRQLELALDGGWGGRRPGAGRPRLGRTPHLTRPKLASRFPVHVNLKLDPSLPNLRTKQVVRLIEKCLRLSRTRDGFRLVHYSVQPHHLHLIVEAQDARALGAGIKGLSVRLARRLNTLLGRKGRVFVDRYYSTMLRTPKQTKAAIAYVLLNARRHDAQRGRARAAGWVDPCSSGRGFDGWRELAPGPPSGEEACVCEPRTWLLARGWRLRGLISVNAVPGER